MRYVVGDKAVVRPDILTLLNGFYKGTDTEKAVKALAGRQVTISDVNGSFYWLKEDEYHCLWSDDTLEDVEFCGDIEEIDVLYG